MTYTNTMNKMKKRGQVEIVALVAFLVVSGALLAGTYLITMPTSNYVGDISTNTFYDCKCISRIDSQNRVLFESYDAGINMSFVYHERCPK